MTAEAFYRPFQADETWSLWCDQGTSSALTECCQMFIIPINILWTVTGNGDWKMALKIIHLQFHLYLNDRLIGKEKT